MFSLKLNKGRFIRVYRDVKDIERYLLDFLTLRL